MKKTLYTLSLLLILSGCYDELDDIGSQIQPDKDFVSVYVDSFAYESRSVLVDSIYAKTPYSLLGETFDPLFGRLKADYICQFYAPMDFTFPDSILNNTIDSVVIAVYYDKIFGDSLTQMQGDVYPVKSALPRNFYSSFDAAQYCDLSTPLSRRSFSAYDVTIPDSVRKTDLLKMLSFHVPLEIGYRFLEESRNTPETFSTLESFTKFFPGVYITTSAGLGSLIDVKYTSLNIHFQNVITAKDIHGKDSIYNQSQFAMFTSTKEVRQLNNIQHGSFDPAVDVNPTESFIKSPSGVNTIIKIPTRQIIEEMRGDFLNNAPLRFKGYPKDEWEYALTPPPALLFIPEDSITTFFEQDKINDNINSFVAILNEKTITYDFKNIAAFIRKRHKDHPDEEFTKIALIPVTYYKNNSNEIERLTNHMTPSAVRLRKDDNWTDIIVTSSEF